MNAWLIFAAQTAGRVGSPNDIGNMVAFLASPAGDCITGAIFRVYGAQCWPGHPSVDSTVLRDQASRTVAGAANTPCKVG